MNIRTKKELITKFFQLMLDAVKQQESQFVDHLASEHKKEFEIAKKKIIENVKSIEIEGLLNVCYNELFYMGPCSIHLIPKLPQNIFDYYEQSYIFAEDTEKLYFTRDGYTEEIHIDDVPRFKKILTDIMSGNKDKCLTNEEINTLITTNGGHIPTKLVNQIEAKRFLSGSADLIEAIHDKEAKRSNIKAWALTLLACVPIVTIPFGPFILNRLRQHFYQKQPIQEKLANHDVITKLNDQPKEPGVSSFFYMPTTSEQVFDKLHKEEIYEAPRWVDGYKNGYHVPYLKKSDFFNSSGEVRKLFSDSSAFVYDFATGGHSPLLGTREQMIRSRLKMFGRAEEIEASKKRSREQVENVVRQVKSCR